MERAAKPPARSLPEALARSLRHEVGDLLQTVYATVAILQRRLPDDWGLERRILSDMRNRAESCKNRLDIVHDLVCPLSYNFQPVKLAGLAATLVESAKARFPQLQVHADAEGAPEVVADPIRLTQLGEVLLSNACEAARKRVVFHTGASPVNGGGKWTITDDGPGVPSEAMPRLFTPFFTTRHGHAGTGLALAHKLVAAHGGQITPENLVEGGFRIHVLFPARPPEESG